uniref:hypothetical protein n=1 Tax=Ningiella ruwaisensis TaxID=2364274 RepID=UPI0010A04FEB|nr:hypothetical protein [Ningiella ruwaisensis]
MTKKNIYIHFGPPKTGTSAIQNYCNTHREHLKSQGIYYPAHKLDSNDVSSGNVESIFDRNEKGELIISSAKVETLITLFNNSSADILLLSSEFFFKRLSEINKYFPESTYIGYVRSPVDFFESSYNQTIKRHGNTKTIQFSDKLNFSIPNVLERSVKSIGKDRFILRAYAKNIFPEKDIVADFLSIFDINKANDYLPRTINPSYSFEALEFKRWLNQFDLAEVSHVTDILLQAYQAGQKEFSLLTPSVFEKYKEQVVEYIVPLTQRLNIENSDALLNSIKSSKQRKYLEQKLNYEQFTQVRDHIKQESEELFFRLCQLLYKHSYLPIFKHQYVKWFLEDHSLSSVGRRRTFFTFLFSKSSLASKKQFFSGYIRQKLGKNQPLTWGKGKSQIHGVDSLKSKLNIAPETSDIAVLMSIANFCEVNGNIEFAFYLVEEALKQAPENKEINTKLASLENALSVHLESKK